MLLPDGRVVELERRAAALVALAALEPGISRLRVATLLWPDSSDPRRNLRQQLLRFRQLFGHPLVEGDATLAVAGGLIETSDDSAAATKPLLAHHDFSDCEQFNAWLQAQRGARQARRAQALGDLIAQAEAEQRFGDAITCVEQQLAAEPSAEVHHRALIRLHYLNQDVARARAAFEALQRLLARDFGARPSAETLALMSLVDQGGPGARPPARVWATALQRPPRMVGRGHELQALRQALAERRALLLLGEAGMGKSRLLAEGLGASTRHVLVKAQAGDAGVPYATLARLLRRLLERQQVPAAPGALARLLPEIGPVVASAAPVPLPVGGERLLLQAAIEQVVLQAGLDVAAVDDLHFADDASLEMITALVGTETLAHMAWVFTQRPGEGSAAARALRDVLEEARRLQAADVAPLDAAQMIELVQSLNLPDVDAQLAGPRLLRHTGGNPLFALETLKQMRPGAGGQVLPQPVSVGALIDRRIRQLSDSAIALARVAAIAGVDFGIALAEHVIGCRAVELTDAWSELESAHVLRDGGFAHDLVADAVLRSIPAPIAQHLHGELARWLAAREGEPARIATHWQAAGEDALAAQSWTAAAHAADRCLRYRESMQCFDRAAALFKALADAPARYAALQGAVDQAALIDVAAAVYSSKVEQLIDAAPDNASRAAALIYRMRILELNGDNEALLREAETAVTLASAEGLTQTEAYALMARGTAQSNLGQAEAALPDFERLAQLGAKLGDPETEGAGHAARATMLLRLGRSVEAIAGLQRARALFERCGQHFRLAMVQQQLSVVHLGQGHAAAALEAADAAVHDALRVDASLDALAHCWLARAMALRSLGRYSEALAAAQPRLDELDAQGNWVADRLRLELAQAYVHLGRVDLAHRLLAQARSPGRLASGEQQRALYVELQLRALGSADTRAASAPLPPRPGPGVEPRRRCELLRALAALAPAQQRAALLDEALRTASEYELPDERCTAQAALAQHLLGAGQTQAAAELMRVAMQDESVVPAGYPPAVAAIAHAVLGASGETAAARRVLEAAVAWIERASNELPPEFQSSFRERNPVNRALLAALRSAGPAR